jgi:Asp-tRNA(Asn)/Glu-tRNA(Gln) amidotransferase C subunit
MRPDEVRPSMPRQDFMKNVPHPDGAFVQVPQVFGEE